MLNISGSYECRIDSKGRLMLPAAFKKQLDSVLKQPFVLKRSPYNTCLELYPVASWNEEMDQFKNLNRFLKETRDFIRRFTAGYKEVELDAVGRLLIPKDLKEFSKIKNEVVLASMQSCIEIWSKPEFNKFENDKNIDTAALAVRVTEGKPK